MTGECNRTFPCGHNDCAGGHSEEGWSGGGRKQEVEGEGNKEECGCLGTRRPKKIGAQSELQGSHLIRLCRPLGVSMLERLYPKSSGNHKDV
jgi:hypothetical protein